MTHNDSSQPVTPTPAPLDAPARAPRPVLRGLAIGAAALGLIAATAAISVAIAGNDDDDRSVAAISSSTDTESFAAFRGPDVTGTIAEFVAARDAAALAAGGGSVVALDRDLRGWEADVFTADGTLEVRLDEALAVIAVGQPDPKDRNDPAPSTVLDGTALNDVISAALTSAGSGAATDVQGADGDDRPGYSVTLVLADGTELDLELATDLTVLSSEIDD